MEADSASASTSACPPVPELVSDTSRALGPWNYFVHKKSVGCAGLPNTRDIATEYRQLSEQEKQELIAEAQHVTDQKRQPGISAPIGCSSRQADRLLKKQRFDDLVTMIARDVKNTSSSSGALVQ